MSVEATLLEASRQAAKTVGEQFGKEQKLLRDAAKRLLRVPREFVVECIEVIPKFLTLLIRVARSKNVDAKLKVTLVGATVVIATVLGVEVAGVSRWTLFAIGAVVGGPFTGVGLAIAHDLTVGIVLVLLVLATCGICISLIGSGALRDLAVELWGEEEGLSFVETLEGAYVRMKRWVDPASRVLSGVFQTVGAKVAVGEKDLGDSVARASSAAIELAAKLGRSTTQQP